MKDFAERIANLSPERLELLAQRLKRKRKKTAARPALTRRGEPAAPAPLSFDQQRLWFLAQLEPDSPAYNILTAARLFGELNLPALACALNEVVRRHDSLRTAFATHQGQPVQVISPGLGIALPLIDLRQLPEKEREAEALRLIKQQARRPFDLRRAPLLRAGILRLSEQEHIAAYTMHHIITDGLSCQLFVDEMATLYEAFRLGRQAMLPELAIQYADYAVWQRQCFTDGGLDSQLSYWKGQLAGAPPALKLPADRPRPPGPMSPGAFRAFAIPRDLYEKIKALKQQEGTTLFTLLLAAWKALLHYYTGQDDLVVGTDISKRNTVETERLIGFFINQLALRTDLSGDPTFHELLNRVRDVTLDAFANQDLPFERVVDAMQSGRHADHASLFQAKIVLQQAGHHNMAFPGLAQMPFEIEKGTAQLDLILNLVASEYELTGVWDYNADLFDDSTIAGMHAHLLSLLDHVTGRPEVRLSEIEQALAAADRRRREVIGEQLKATREQKFKRLQGKLSG